MGTLEAMALYRGHRRSCPACRSAMDEIPVPLASGEQAKIDHCPQCGGVFLEFFDGDPGELSRGTLERLVDQDSDAADVAHETATCPECGNFMPLLRYLEQGPTIFRCEGCMAIFASHPQLRALAAYVEPANPEEPPSLLERLKALFSGG